MVFKTKQTKKIVWPFTKRNLLLEICAKEIWMCSQLSIRMMIVAIIGENWKHLMSKHRD